MQDEFEAFDDPLAGSDDNGRQLKNQQKKAPLTI